MLAKQKEEEKEEAQQPVIENIKADKLTGPKILGKIELPVGDEARTKPKPNEEKRKRKRIPIEKKDQQQSQQTAQEHSQAQKIARMMEDPHGKDLTIALADQAFRNVFW